MLNKAVLFLVFNRPDTTKKVFEAIREARPPRLYIASDGARENKIGEKEKCDEVKKIVENIDWECEVKTLFRNKNLGCGVAVSEAINWFFENEEDGIILEDDCLPDQTFFSYCETMLDYYKDNESVMHISASHYLDFKYGNSSYYFTSIEDCWGWASWRSAWEHFDFTLEKYPLQMIEEKLFYMYSNYEMRDYWKNICVSMKENNKTDIWDYQWTLSIIANDGICINSNTNLISNIGFDGDGTHTFGKNHPLANTPTYPLTDIKHSTNIKRSMFIDEYIMKSRYSVKVNQSEIINKKLDRLINELAWLIPIRKWRDAFRSRVKEE